MKWNNKNTDSEKSIQKKIILQISFYLLTFLISYAAFYAYAFLNDTITRFQYSIQKNLEQYDIYVDKITWSLFSRSMSIHNIYYNNTKKIPIIDNIELSFLLFAKEIKVQAQVNKGNITVNLNTDSLFKPTELISNINWNNINIQPLWEIIAKNTSLPINMQEGLSSGKFQAEVPLQNFKPNIKNTSGTLFFNINEAHVSHSIPLLKEPILRNITSILDATWKNEELTINTLIENPLFKISQSGVVTINFLNSIRSNLDINVQVNIDQKDIHTAIVPAKTLASIKETGAVKMKLTQSLNNIHIQLL